jgi:hypothetical protein
MAVIYDDLIVTYDYGLVTYDGDQGTGSMSGSMSEGSTMTGTITY